MTEARADVLIAGGGPSGLAAALVLAVRGARVLVLEPGAEEETPRAEMLPPGAFPVLERLGVADIIDRSVPLGPALSLWAGARPETIGHGMGLQPPAISLDRRRLGALLRARAAAHGVEIRALRPTRIAGRAGDWRVTAVGAGALEIIRARFLVDASGRPARLARRLGARLHLGPPLLARMRHLSAGLDPRLVIEATPNGWWYALPLEGGGGTLGFVSEPGAEADEPTLLPAAEGALDGASCRDARMARLSPVAGAGWLCTGDAAAAFDPISSQGLFNALSGGFFAGNAAADVLSGRADALEVYADLVVRTAERTHWATPLHYASARRRSPFWQRRQTFTSRLFATAGEAVPGAAERRAEPSRSHPLRARETVA